MSIRSIGAIAVLAASALCAAPAAWAQDATVKQVYEAAEAGKFIEAQAMMDKVLADHPNSAKAHFIEAELLAKQGKFARAGTELATAERLAPGLPFAKPAAVEKLRSLVAGARTRSAPAASPVQARAAAPDMSYERQTPASGGIPWGMIALVGGLVALAVMYFRHKSASQAAQGRYSPTAGPAGMPGMGAQNPQYPNAGQAPYGPAAAPGGGIGSGIMGGLATGAALGAGMVAGQALAHHFTDGDRSNRDSNANNPTSNPEQFTPIETPPSGYDMGGGDFGVSDPGNWDSGGGDSGGGGSDWD
jgi:hypothetical protein